MARNQPKRKRLNQVWAMCHCGLLTFHKVDASYDIHNVTCPWCNRDFSFSIKIDTLKQIKE
jgi:hypothetical protein